MNKITGLLFLLVIFSGCKGLQWAESAQATIHRKFPELEAQNCADRFPVIKDSTTVTDTVISYANNINYTSIIDSLYAVAFNEIEPLPANDTCVTKVQPYIEKINGLQRQIKAMREAYKPCDTTYVHINHRTLIREENTAKTEVFRRQAEAAKKKLSSWQVSTLILACLLFISFIGLWLALKNKK